ncbi:MAG: hypothetical protein D6679_05495 [Candidatus Hydrogenedentota bacterium]|nr:MAG: hypothetical protein D6679_05495 [Candidatus Hydrogenedentota bacterium]
MSETSGSATETEERSNETRKKEESGKERRRLPGQALYAELTSRFACRIRPELPDEEVDRMLDEYGFLFFYSIDESDQFLLREKLDLTDKSWEDRLLKAVAFHRHGDLQKAEKEYQSLLIDFPERKEPEYNLAVLHFLQGRSDEAAEHLRRFEEYLSSATVATRAIEDFRNRVEELRKEIAQY